MNDRIEVPSRLARRPDGELVSMAHRGHGMNLHKNAASVLLRKSLPVPESKLQFPLKLPPK